MRFLTLMFLFPASAAQAHVGHMGDLAGHDHWVAAGAVGLAGLVAVWGALKGKNDAAKTKKPQGGDQGQAPQTDDKAGA